jgi:hypothetical protein
VLQEVMMTASVLPGMLRDRCVEVVADVVSVKLPRGNAFQAHTIGNASIMLVREGFADS